LGSAYATEGSDSRARINDSVEDASAALITVNPRIGRVTSEAPTEDAVRADEARVAPARNLTMTSPGTARGVKSASEVRATTRVLGAAEARGVERAEASMANTAADAMNGFLTGFPS
jgi:hypothetical protein